MRGILTFVFISTFSLSFCQNIDTLKLRTTLLVHADFEDFILNNQSREIDDIAAKYNVITLKSNGIFDCLFFKVSVKDTVRKCDYYLAYNLSDESFYRLRGFKTSEFNDFANKVLLGGNVRLPESMKNEKIKSVFSYICKNVDIENINLSEYFKEYYKKPMNSLHDKYSCFHKFQITVYK